MVSANCNLRRRQATRLRRNRLTRQKAITIMAIKLSAATKFKLRKVSLALARIGWGRPSDIALYTNWPGKQSTEVIRQICVQGVAAGLLVAKTLPGTPGEIAYMHTDKGDRWAREQGAHIIGRSYNLAVGERWHEHVMAIAVAAVMKEHGYEFYFAREVRWAIDLLMSGKAAPDAFFPDLISLGVDQLRKFPDGVTLRTVSGRTPVAVELEYSEKKSDAAARQVASCLGAKKLAISILIAYCYPPDSQKRILERRLRYSKSTNKNDSDAKQQVRKNPRPPKAIDHEGAIARNFYARSRSLEDMLHIRLLRMYFDDGLRYQRHELIPLTQVKPHFTQAIGTSNLSKAENPDWSEPEEQPTVEGTITHDFKHIASGCWIRIIRHLGDGEDAYSGWDFLAWMESREHDGVTCRVDYPGSNNTHQKSIQQDPHAQWLLRDAVRRAKAWFLQEREEYLAKIGRR